MTFDFSKIDMELIKLNSCKLNDFFEVLFDKRNFNLDYDHEKFEVNYVFRGIQYIFKGCIENDYVINYKCGCLKISDNFPIGDFLGIEKLNEKNSYNTENFKYPAYIQYLKYANIVFKLKSFIDSVYEKMIIYSEDFSELLFIPQFGLNILMNNKKDRYSNLKKYYLFLAKKIINNMYIHSNYIRNNFEFNDFLSSQIPARYTTRYNIESALALIYMSENIRKENFENDLFKSKSLRHLGFKLFYQINNITANKKKEISELINELKPEFDELDQSLRGNIVNSKKLCEYEDNGKRLLSKLRKLEYDIFDKATERKGFINKVTDKYMKHDKAHIIQLLDSCDKQNHYTINFIDEFYSKYFMKDYDFKIARQYKDCESILLDMLFLSLDNILEDTVFWEYAEIIKDEFLQLKSGDITFHQY